MTSRPVSGNFASKSVAMEKPLDQQARVLAVFEQAVSLDCGLLRSKPRCSGGMASSAPYSLTNSRGSGTGVAKTDVSSGNARVRVLRRDGFIMAFFLFVNEDNCFPKGWFLCLLCGIVTYLITHIFPCTMIHSGASEGEASLERVGPRQSSRS